MTSLKSYEVKIGSLEISDKWMKLLFAALSAITGLILVIAGYRVLVESPDMHMRIYQVVRMLIALGAGFIAGALTGTFTLNGTWPTISIKAGGPVGVAVFFYIVDPALLS